MLRGASEESAGSGVLGVASEVLISIAVTGSGQALRGRALCASDAHQMCEQLVLG